jgi:hypothetical protein
MFMARLRGKLPSEIWLGSEDLLTSAVFGTLKYLPPTLAADLLARASPLEGAAPLALSGPLEWQFWPWWDICEPDVVIEDARTLCVVEAKLYAEFGESEIVGHQLDREWRDGSRRADAAHKQLWLLVVTNHASLPAEAIRRQLANSDADRRRVCWLSWLTIGQFLRERGTETTTGMFDDLLELLTRMGLAPFPGFGELAGQCGQLLGEWPWTTGVSFGTGEERSVAGFGASLDIAMVLGDRIHVPRIMY